MKINVHHDTAEHEVAINQVKCDYCGTKVSGDEIIRNAHFDQAICEECWAEHN